MRTAVRLILATHLAAGAMSPARADVPPPAPPPTAPPVSEGEPRVEPRPVPPNATALQLFTSVEAAWSMGDAEALAALVDTTQVRIGLKPGSTPTAAMTRSAATFLFQDQLRLVKTQSFRVQRVNAQTATAESNARWVGDWGGREGMRRLSVTLKAASAGGRWWLREVRVKG